MQSSQRPLVVELSISVVVLCGMVWLYVGAVSQYGVAKAITFIINAMCSKINLQKKNEILFENW